MKVALHLPTPSRSWGASIDDLVTIARAAEQHGLHGVSSSDHPFPVVERGQPAHHVLDPFIVLSHVSAATERLALIFSLLVAPYRNPFLAAAMLATLQDASGGRVIAGLGAGYQRAEFDALGARFAGRGAQVEAVEAAMRSAWSGEPLTGEGDGWTATGNSLRPAVGVPVWRGGNAPAALRHAATRCEGWMPLEANDAIATGSGTRPLTVDTIAAHVTRLNVLAGGRRPEVYLVRTHPRWLEDPARALDECARLGEAGVSWVEAASRGRSLTAVLEDIELIAQATGVTQRLDGDPEPTR